MTAELCKQRSTRGLWQMNANKGDGLQAGSPTHPAEKALTYGGQLVLSENIDNVIKRASCSGAVDECRDTTRIMIIRHSAHTLSLHTHTHTYIHHAHTLARAQRERNTYMLSLTHTHTHRVKDKRANTYTHSYFSLPSFHDFTTVVWFRFFFLSGWIIVSHV